MKSSLLEIIGWIIAGFFCMAIGVVTTLYVYNTKISSTSEPVKENSRNPQTDNYTSKPFSLAPPAQSLKGVLTTMTGSVLHKTRDANIFVEATPSATIFIGESIATNADGKATILIPNLSNISIGKNAEIVFVNIFPENTVFQQKNGKILYDMTSTSPVAIRALHTLIQASKTRLSVNIIDSDISVSVEKGEAKVAFVDTDNITHVYTILDGKQANIDDASRTITIVSPRQ